MNHLQKLIEQEIRKILAEGFKGFDLAYFQRLGSYEEMYEYAKEHLDLMGKGVSRAVFRWKAGKVIKVVYSEWGTEQNKNEVKNWKTHKDDNLVAQIIDYDKEHFRWILAESVKVFAGNKDLKSQLSDVSYRLWSELEEVIVDHHKWGFQQALRTAIKYKNHEMKIYGRGKMISVDMLTELDIKLLEKMYQAIKAGLRDVTRLGQWGVSSSGEIVLADYGDGKEKKWM